VFEQRDPDLIARRLRLLRIERQLTQRQLADRAGVSVEAISTIERGRKQPRLGTAELLAAVLDVPVGTLFRIRRRG
jgi:transcriptional regulator with XRE-family HTH domain